MSTPTPENDPMFMTSEELQAELSSANARIAELEKEKIAEYDRGRLHEACEQENLVDSLTRQLSESQAQFRIAQNRVHWPEPPEDCIFCETYPATGSPQEVPMCKLCCLESERESLTAQLASAREDEKLYRELEISITDVQDWSGTRVGDALDAIDSARGVTSPSAVTDTGEKDAWQPIETAPKDGTNIMLYSDHQGFHQAFWSPIWERWLSLDDGKSVYGTMLNPIAWGVLPPPPQVKERE